MKLNIEEFYKVVAVKVDLFESEIVNEVHLKTSKEVSDYCVKNKRKDHYFLVVKM